MTTSIEAIDMEARADKTLRRLLGRYGGAIPLDEDFYHFIVDVYTAGAIDALEVIKK